MYTCICYYFISFKLFFVIAFNMTVVGKDFQEIERTKCGPDVRHVIHGPGSRLFEDRIAIH